jgi:hypothetical protein
MSDMSGIARTPTDRVDNRCIPGLLSRHASVLLGAQCLFLLVVSTVPLDPFHCSYCALLPGAQLVPLRGFQDGRRDPMDTSTSVSLEIQRLVIWR